MKSSIYSVAFVALFVAFICPQNSYSKDKSQTWAGTYVLKGGGGGLTIEKEGKKLWVEIWRDFKAGEEKRPGEEKYEEVYFASIHGKTAKRLPFRGNICPNTFILKAEGVKLIDECSDFSPIIYYFERVK
jgi:hypothetical protein